jgi:hypothetical protein
VSGPVCEVLIEEVSAGRWRLSEVRGATLHGSRELAMRWANRMAGERPLVVREPR